MANLKQPQAIFRPDGGLSARESFLYSALRQLERDPHLTQRALALQLGVSVGHVNSSLVAMVERGLLVIDRPSDVTAQRCRIYTVTPQGIAHLAALAVPFVQRKRAELNALAADISDVESRYLQSETRSPDGEGEGQ